MKAGRALVEAGIDVTMQAMASTVKRTATPDEVALLLHQVSPPAARRDYELRSSSPASRAPRAATSSSQLVSRAFQNARAMSFNATAHNKDVPIVTHSERVFFSGPLSSHGVAQHPAMGVVRAPAAGGDERRDNDTGSNVGSTSRDHACEQVRIPEGQNRMVRAISARPVLGNWSGREARTARIGEAPRRARSGDLRAPPKSSTSFNNENRLRSSELSREIMRTSSSTWGREDVQTRIVGAMGARDVMGARDATRVGEMTEPHDVMRAHDVARESEKVPKVEEKKRGENRRRPTASIAWDSLNESQASSPQHELAAIPFKWEEAPGKPLALRVREDSQPPTARLATTALRADAGPLSRVEELADVRAKSHRFYARVASQSDLLPARKSSFDSASAHLISEVVSSIDLVAPAAAKFLVESWVSPNVAPEAHVAVPFQWEEAPGVPLKLDGDEEAARTSIKPMVPLQLPPRLASPAPAHSAMSKEDMRGRLRTRSTSGPLAGYYPHASPARRRQLQHSPVPQRRSCSPSKRSISPSRIHAIAQHFSSHRKQMDRSHSVLTASLEAELGDTGGSGGYGAGLGRSASGALLPEFGRSPRRYNLSPTRRAVSPSQRIQALAKQLTCKIRPAASEFPPNAIFAKSPQADPWSSVNHPDELLSGPSSSNSDMDASSQTPPSESAFSKALSCVSYESFEHSFAHRAAAAANSGSSPSRDEALLASPPPSSTDDSKKTRNSNANSNSNVKSAPGSPYLGPSCEDGFKGQHNRKEGSPLGAAEGTVKAVVKICRNGSSALRKKSTQQTSAHDLWAPTLASYFHCLEAATLISHPGGARAPAALTSSSSPDRSPSPSVSDSPLAATRLPYTMPSVSSEQNLLWKDYCESPNSQLGTTSCLGVKIAPASLFLSRGSNKRFPALEMSSAVGWRDAPASLGGLHCSATATEEGFRSPAYAATLELLSPSADVFRKKKSKRHHLGMGGSSGARRIKLVLPSTRRRSQIMEAICTSLKRALYKCARRCRRKACSPRPLGSALSR